MVNTDILYKPQFEELIATIQSGGMSPDDIVAQLESIDTHLSQIAWNTSSIHFTANASAVSTTPITGLTGGNVQEVLASINNVKGNTEFTWFTVTRNTVYTLNFGGAFYSPCIAVITGTGSGGAILFGNRTVLPLGLSTATSLVMEFVSDGVFTIKQDVNSSARIGIYHPKDTTFTIS